MSEENRVANALRQAEQAVRSAVTPKKFVMEITLTVSAPGKTEFDVNGPLADRALCYGMLEMARDVVREFHDEKRRRETGEQALLVPAPRGLVV